MGFAFQGWRTAWRREANFRIHTMAAILVVAALLAIRPAPIWWALVLVVVALVLAFELMNAALEAVIDRLHPELHDEIKAAKDMAAGAVLAISCAAVAVAGAFLWEWWR